MITFAALNTGKVYKVRTDETNTQGDNEMQRRTLIAALGLAPFAVGAEAFMTPPDKPGEIRSVTGAWKDEHAAKALEALAAELRAGRVSVENLSVYSKMHANDIADHHELILTFIYKPEV